MHSNAFEVTIELTCCKHLPADKLEDEWFNNKEAMLRYMEATHTGVRGLVVDEDGNPIRGARVSIDLQRLF